MRRFFLPLVCFLATSLLWAGKFWQDSSYFEWSQKQAFEVIQDSPWAQAQTFTSGLATGAGTNIPSAAPRTEQRTGDLVQSRQYFVRFQSAAPVRMALARLQLLQNRVTREQAEEYVATDPIEGKIVLILRLGTGQDPTEIKRNTAELLRKDTYLLLAQSKKKIYLEDYQLAGPSEAVFIFPRQEDGVDLVTLEEKEVRFITELSNDTKLNRKFKLKDMVFQGELAI